MSDRGLRWVVAGPCLVATLVSAVWIALAWQDADAIVTSPVCSPSVSGSCLEALPGRLVQREQRSPRDATFWGIEPDGAAYVAGSASFPWNARSSLNEARGDPVTGLFHGAELAGVSLPDGEVLWSSDAAETRILLGPFLLMLGSALVGGGILFVASRRGRSLGRDSSAAAVPGITLFASFALGLAAGWGSGLVVACLVCAGVWLGLWFSARRVITRRGRSRG